MENKKIKINEIIVVEGRDDVTALKRTVDAHIIPLNGFCGISKNSIQKLKDLSQQNNLILLTDPDFAGKKIRDTIKKEIPNIKHAFISRKNAEKNNNIGVENASDEAIIQALENIITQSDKITSEKYIFTINDLIEHNLCFGENSKERRIQLGDTLKIGYYNTKQLLNALNSFNISKEDFEKAINKI